eukprot:scaffold12252_cov93-Isochrysis_galbana.AAC.3
MLNHHTRLLRPDLTSSASYAADDAVAEAVAHAVAISPECYHPSHPSFAYARLHLPITSTTATSCDGGGAGIPSLQSTRTPAFLASFIDTLPLLTADPQPPPCPRPLSPHHLCLLSLTHPPRRCHRLHPHHLRPLLPRPLSRPVPLLYLQSSHPPH